MFYGYYNKVYDSNNDIYNERKYQPLNINKNFCILILT